MEVCCGFFGFDAGDAIEEEAEENPFLHRRCRTNISRSTRSASRAAQARAPQEEEIP